MTQEVEAEQGVIVKNSVGGANDGLAISLGIPSEADARLEIVFVGLNAFLQSQRAIGRKSEALRGPEFGWELHVVAHAVVKCKVVAYRPGILPEQTEGLICKGVGRTADALAEVPREAGSVRYYA